MSTSITLRTKIRINGREYANVDDMPADVRQAYDKALAAIRGAKHADLPASAVVLSTTKIIFEGKEYRSVEEMPVDVRRHYEAVMAAALESDSSGSRSAATVPGQKPQRGDAVSLPKSLRASSALRAESTPWWVPIAAVVIAALLCASFVFGR